MKTVYLAGHGSWNLQDGYTTVPKGCSISFYTEFSKNMFTADMKAIIAGTYGGTIQTVIREYKQVQNYTLSGDPVSLVECQNLLLARNNMNLALIMFGAGAVTLSQIFDMVKANPRPIDFIWCACRFTGLQDVGGKAIGVNGAQGTFGNRNHLGHVDTSGSPDLYYFNPTTHIIKNL